MDSTCKVDEVTVDCGRVWASHSGDGRELEVIVRLDAVEAVEYVPSRRVGGPVPYDSDQELHLSLRSGRVITLTADADAEGGGGPGTELLWEAWDSIERIWRGEVRDERGVFRPVHEQKDARTAAADASMVAAR